MYDEANSQQDTEWQHQSSKHLSLGMYSPYASFELWDDARYNRDGVALVYPGFNRTRTRLYRRGNVFA
jgi:hypothetical protein